MYLYVDILGIFSKKLDKTFLPDSDWSWEDWEIFIADFIASHITMINMMNKNKLLRLRNFFHGGQGSDTTLNLVFNFEPVEVYTLKHQFPCLDLSTKEGKKVKYIDLKTKKDEKRKNVNIARKLKEKAKKDKEDAKTSDKNMKEKL